MSILTRDYIKTKIANSSVIYKRGENIYRLGNFTLREADRKKNTFTYGVDGDYGDYEITVHITEKSVTHACTCPFPYKGCKHTVAACLDLVDLLARDGQTASAEAGASGNYLSFEEIKNEALASRQLKAKAGVGVITLGDTYRGEHLVATDKGREYLVTVYEPQHDRGHCTCPDYRANHLYTCKHLLAVLARIKGEPGFDSQIGQERFSYAHITWDAYLAKPRCYAEPAALPRGMRSLLDQYFNESGIYKRDEVADLFELIEAAQDEKPVRFDEFMLFKLQQSLYEKEMGAARKKYRIDFSQIRVELYPYQKQGVEFGLFKKSVLIADEMGLGKTLQAITLAVLKRDLFGFTKTLIITPSSLKEQWRREIGRFTGESALIVSGPRKERHQAYQSAGNYFFIANYEAVQRDILAIRRFKPDIVILDEAQRIKNFSTRTHETIASIPHRHSIVLTGTPLENKLEDLYAIMQFTDPELLSPLWLFAGEHFLIDRNRKGKVQGYKNLERLHEKLKNVIIRRRKEEVLENLPDQVTNNYYLGLSAEQHQIHQGIAQSLLPLAAKKFLTPMDIKRIYQMLTAMRMVCNSTYLIDRKTNISPKLDEFESIIRELVIENRRKAVVFTEWTSMTYLIGKTLSNLGIPFVEFTGKVAVDKRQALVNEFTANPDCMVFLSTDAGGVGLNLQAADCVINFELPWNPAKLNQRIGRVMRIGQKSASVNVINLISRPSIEERVFAGIHMKQDLFNSVIEGEGDFVKFGRERKDELINTIRRLFGENENSASGEPLPVVELAESTPHFMNPEILARAAEEGVDITAEESSDIVAQGESVTIGAAPVPIADEEPAGVETESSPLPAEKMEKVLEQGMQFLSGLMEMTTGKPLIAEAGSPRVSVDRETGEITMRFKINP